VSYPVCDELDWHFDEDLQKCIPNEICYKGQATVDDSDITYLEEYDFRIHTCVMKRNYCDQDSGTPYNLNGACVATCEDW